MQSYLLKLRACVAAVAGASSFVIPAAVCFTPLATEGGLLGNHTTCLAGSHRAVELDDPILLSNGRR